MSREEVVRCDGCGQVVVDGTQAARGMAWFTREGWGSQETLDLCGACADQVQRFIRGAALRDGAGEVPDGR